MAKNISLLGADYPGVPAVQLPQTGGGTAMFVDPDDLEGAIAIVQTGDTTTQAISYGEYVLWKHDIYMAKSNIASGDTLSSSNLQAITDGGLNSLYGKVKQNNIAAGTVDLNTLTSVVGDPEKTYSIGTMGYVTNGPSGLNASFPAMLKVNSIGGYGSQELFAYTSDGKPNIWYRQQYYNNGSKTWGAWQNIIHA